MIRAVQNLRAGLTLWASSSAAPADPLAPFAEYLRGAMTAAGVSMNADRAMRISAVRGCVSILTEGVASLPLNVYRRLPNGGKELANEHPAWRILHTSASHRDTPIEYLSLQQRDLELHGNSLAVKVRVNDALDGLHYVEWKRVTPHEDHVGRVFYEIRPKGSGVTTTLPKDRVLHLRGPFGTDVEGGSVVTEMADLFGLAYAIQAYLAYTFKNGVRLSGALSTPNKLSDKAYDRLKTWIKEEFEGVTNAGKLMLLEEQLGWVSTSQNNRDAQTVELAEKVDAGIARVFQVPLHMLASNIAQPRANMEQQAREFVQQALRGRLRRIEQRFDLDVLGGDPEYFTRFDLDELLRGDAKTLAEVHTLYLTNGVLNPNEARGDLGRNPREGGDSYVRPLNMGQEQDTTKAPAPEPPARRDRPPAEDAALASLSTEFGNRVELALARLRHAAADEEQRLDAELHRVNGRA